MPESLNVHPFLRFSRKRLQGEGSRMTGEELPVSGGTVYPQRGWVLVLASHTHLRGLLLQVLSRAGYVALGSATLSQAEPALRRFALPGLIIFDEMEANEEALALRVQQLTALLPLEAGCPLLILSAMHPLPRAKSLPGAARVVVKPFNLAHLLSLVSSLLASPQENAH